MLEHIKVAILEDHQSIIDSYVMRLREAKEIQIVGIAYHGEELDNILAARRDVNVLIMDIQVPISLDDKNYIFMPTYIPKILESNPNLSILMISMLKEQVFIRALVEAGVSGYIFKDDGASIRKLHIVVKKIARGEKYFSEGIKATLEDTIPNRRLLTQRQLEILAVCAAHPDASSDQLAIKIGISGSTVRNALSESYQRLNVRNKTAALARAKSLGLIL